MGVSNEDNKSRELSRRGEDLDYIVAKDPDDQVSWAECHDHVCQWTRVCS